MIRLWIEFWAYAWDVYDILNSDFSIVEHACWLEEVDTFTKITFRNVNNLGKGLIHMIWIDMTFIIKIKSEGDEKLEGFVAVGQFKLSQIYISKWI